MSMPHLGAGWEDFERSVIPCNYLITSPLVALTTISTSFSTLDSQSLSGYPQQFCRWNHQRGLTKCFFLSILVTYRCRIWWLTSMVGRWAIPDQPALAL